MHFSSDNTSGAHPKILEAIVRANDGFSPTYGTDALMDEVTRHIRDIFEAPQAAVHLVTTGTAANALALATIADPWTAIFCTPMAHIVTSECNAPEFFSGGAKLAPVAETNACMCPASLRAAIISFAARGKDFTHPGAVSLTSLTERGTIYPLADLQTVCSTAHEFGLPVHLDGARFANAIAALGCSPAEMTWKAGVDILTLGASKNGCLGVEAVVLFDPARSKAFEFRRKRAGHMLSKHRFLSAQMLAYLEDGLWLELAHAANRIGARLAAGLKGACDTGLLYEPQANLLFASIPERKHLELKAAGADYSLYDLPALAPDAVSTRLVTSWCNSDEDVDRFLDIAGR